MIVSLDGQEYKLVSANFIKESHKTFNANFLTILIPCNNICMFSWDQRGALQTDLVQFVALDFNMMITNHPDKYFRETDGERLSIQ